MSNVKVNTINDVNGGSNAVLYGVAAPANSMGFRNRIINGDMRIDQRNAGASVAITGAGQFLVDRFALRMDASTGTTAARSTVAPSGFSNSLIITVGTGAAPSSTQVGFIDQRVEGFNVADLSWGNADAQSITVSFRVRSSLTGSFGAAIRNSATNRCYVFPYTINAANTWEIKTVTIPGDTSGTWLTDNGVGLYLSFDIGEGSNRNASTTNSWLTTNTPGLTGGVKLCATSGATFYITGVQLEAGSVASPFERRDYGRELMMCQRYCFVHSAANGAAVYSILNVGVNISTTSPYINYVLPVTMRSAPTFTWNGSFQDGLSGATGTSIISSANGNSPTQVVLIGTYSSGSGTTGYANLIRANNSTTFSAIFSSEL